jgi:hypothetical protein
MTREERHAVGGCSDGRYWPTGYRSISPRSTPS